MGLGIDAAINWGFSEAKWLFQNIREQGGLRMAILRCKSNLFYPNNRHPYCESTNFNVGVGRLSLDHPKFHPPCFYSTSISLKLATSLQQSSDVFSTFLSSQKINAILMKNPFLVLFLFHIHLHFYERMSWECEREYKDWWIDFLDAEGRTVETVAQKDENLLILYFELWCTIGYKIEVEICG